MNIEEIEPRAGLREVQGQAESYCEICGASKRWPIRKDSSRAVADWISHHLDLRCWKPSDGIFGAILRQLRRERPDLKEWAE